MTRDAAVEKCVKAVLRQKHYAEQNWRDYPVINDLAKDVLAMLEELGPIKLDAMG
jgi:hypothetical protein